jgi:hypothetical protein
VHVGHSVVVGEGAGCVAVMLHTLDGGGWPFGIEEEGGIGSTSMLFSCEGSIDVDGGGFLLLSISFL